MSSNPRARKQAILQRLQNRLKLKSESLADHFEFIIYIGLIHKDPKKTQIYRSADVQVLMNNRLEQQILYKSQQSCKSVDDVNQLINDDIVQLHVASYNRVKQGDDNTIAVTNETESMDFRFWPRKDFEKLCCVVLSRWKHDVNAPFRCLQRKFSLSFVQEDVDNYTRCSKYVKDVFVGGEQDDIFIMLQKNKGRSSKKCAFRAKRLCVFLPQNQLTCWNSSSESDVIDKLLFTL